MTEDKHAKAGRLRAEMLVGISAVVIGVCALAVSLYETNLMRAEQRAAVLPLLELSSSHYTTGGGESANNWRLILHAENVGIGPARVRDFRVMVDSVPRATWRDVMQALLGREVNVAHGQSTINGRTIPPERIVEMFVLNDSSMANEFVQQFARLDFEACFCSVFDECWTTRYSTFGAASSVDACERSGSSFAE